MELLIRVVDGVSDNPVLDVQLTKAGDVIAYHTKADCWGLQEINNPEWKIIRVVGLTVDEGDALVGRELPVSPYDHGQLLRDRHIRVNLTKLDLSKTEVDVYKFRAAMEVKSPLFHPSETIGPKNENVIG